MKERAQNEWVNRTIDPQIRIIQRDFGLDTEATRHLVTYLLDRSLQPQQIPSLLKVTCQRISALRSFLREFMTRNADDEGLSKTANGITQILAEEKQFNIDTLLERVKIFQDSMSDSLPDPGMQSEALEILALSRAVGLLHPESAESYARAASVPGIDSGKQWQYQMARTMILIESGDEFGFNPALEQAISVLQNEILPLVPEQSPEWAAAMLQLGKVQGILGQRQIGTRKLQESISSLNQALSCTDQSKFPKEWAETQGSLGKVLGILGQRQKDDEMLSQSVKAFEAALEAWPMDDAIEERTAVCNNLAAVLQTIGQHTKDTKTLKKSVDAYREVLQIWTREHAPWKWASVMNNMGITLRLLGEQRKGPRTLEQSVATGKNALSVRSRDTWPREWAMSQNNLGAALQKLGDRNNDPDILEQAITAYENALTEWTREQQPMTWAMTMANLAVARKTLAELNRDSTQAQKAVMELEAVTEVFRQASHAHYSELSIDQLAKARKLAENLVHNPPESSAPDVL